MAVYTGDPMARNFGNGSAPFHLEENDGACWSDPLAKHDETITAVSTTRINGRRGILIIDGKVPPPQQ